MPEEQTPPNLPTPPIVPPKRASLFEPFHKNKKLLIPFISLGVLLFLAVLVTLFRAGLSLLRPSRPAYTPPPAIVRPTIPTSPTATPSGQIVNPDAPRLSLNTIEGRKLVTVSESKLWIYEFTREGPRRSLLFDPKGEVLELALSPNRNLLAFTYTTSGTPTPSGTNFPSTGLSVLDLRDKSITEYETLGKNIIRRPTWSSDSLYLATWNHGQSLFVFDAVAKKRVLEINSSAALGQVAFIPDQARISYVEGNTLYESEYTGTHKTTILTDATPNRVTPSGQLIPDRHFFLGNSNQFVYHNNLGQLVLYRRSDTSRIILAEASSGQYYPYGEYVSFNPRNDQLVYINLGKEVYVAGPDDNPLYYFDINSRSGNPFFPVRKTPITITGLMPDPSSSKILMANPGFRVFSHDGRMLSNCEFTNILNDYTYDPQRFWSLDSKYIFSEKTFQVADVDSCAITAPIEPNPPSLSIWVK